MEKVIGREEINLLDGILHHDEGIDLMPCNLKLAELDLKCQMAHCGRYIPHFDFGAKPSPIVPYRHLPQTLSGMTADCRSLV